MTSAEPLRALEPQDVEPIHADPAHETEADQEATKLTAAPPTGTEARQEVADITAATVTEARQEVTDINAAPATVTEPAESSVAVTAPEEPIIAPPMSGATSAPATVPEPAAPAPVSSSLPTAAPGRLRHALIAEDSITARIFLTRQLEQRGFVVHAVGTAAELDALLPSGPWTLVCVDIELPDAGGREFIVEMGRRSAAADARLIVLVRDGDDEAVARSAGIGATLRKPFERVHLDHAIAGLAAPPAGDRSAR
jgi:CheY-like chemotaxis protein